MTPAPTSRDALAALIDKLDGDSLDAICEVIGSPKLYNDGKSMMRSWFLDRLRAFHAALLAERPGPPADGWRPIETAPKDGTRFWGQDGDDAIAMFWHDGFREFVSRFHRMTMAAGYTINGKPYEDHSPTIHKPQWWMAIPPTPIPSDPEERA